MRLVIQIAAGIVLAVAVIGGGALAISAATKSTPKAPYGDLLRDIRRGDVETIQIEEADKIATVELHDGTEYETGYASSSFLEFMLREHGGPKPDYGD
jgi:hypothetical protein